MPSPYLRQTEFGWWSYSAKSFKSYAPVRHMMCPGKIVPILPALSTKINYTIVTTGDRDFNILYIKFCKVGEEHIKGTLVLVCNRVHC
jgi:hypothetical protein